MSWFWVNKGWGDGSLSLLSPPRPAQGCLSLQALQKTQQTELDAGDALGDACEAQREVRGAGAGFRPNAVSPGKGVKGEHRGGEGEPGTMGSSVKTSPAVGVSEQRLPVR